MFLFGGYLKVSWPSLTVKQGLGSFHLESTSEVGDLEWDRRPPMGGPGPTPRGTENRETPPNDLSINTIYTVILITFLRHNFHNHKTHLFKEQNSQFLVNLQNCEAITSLQSLNISITSRVSVPICSRSHSYPQRQARSHRPSHLTLSLTTPGARPRCAGVSGPFLFTAAQHAIGRRSAVCPSTRQLTDMCIVSSSGYCEQCCYEHSHVSLCVTYMFSFLLAGLKIFGHSSSNRVSAPAVGQAESQRHWPLPVTGSCSGNESPAPFSSTAQGQMNSFPCIGH